MKPLALLLAIGHIVLVDCSPSLPLLNPGGIGGIFKGPNSETVVKGPDGSQITSAAIGGEVQTGSHLQPIVVADAQPIVSLPVESLPAVSAVSAAPVITETVVHENVAAPAIAVQPVATAAVAVDVQEPHIIETELVDAPDVEPNQSSDLHGPSGTIVTRGSKSIISGPASTTITEPVRKVPVVPIVPAIPIAATVPVADPAPVVASAAISATISAPAALDSSSGLISSIVQPVASNGVLNAGIEVSTAAPILSSTLAPILSSTGAPLTIPAASGLVENSGGISSISVANSPPIVSSTPWAPIVVDGGVGGSGAAGGNSVPIVSQQSVAINSVDLGNVGGGLISSSPLPVAAVSHIDLGESRGFAAAGNGLLGTNAALAGHGINLGPGIVSGGIISSTPIPLAADNSDLRSGAILSSSHGIETGSVVSSTPIPLAGNNGGLLRSYGALGYNPGSATGAIISSTAVPILSNNINLDRNRHLVGSGVGLTQSINSGAVLDASGGPLLSSSPIPLATGNIGDYERNDLVNGGLSSTSLPIAIANGGSHGLAISSTPAPVGVDNSNGVSFISSTSIPLGVNDIRGNINLGYGAQGISSSSNVQLTGEVLSSSVNPGHLEAVTPLPIPSSTPLGIPSSTIGPTDSYNLQIDLGNAGVDGRQVALNANAQIPQGAYLGPQRQLNLNPSLAPSANILPHESAYEGFRRATGLGITDIRHSTGQINDLGHSRVVRALFKKKHKDKEKDMRPLSVFASSAEIKPGGPLIPGARELDTLYLEPPRLNNPIPNHIMPDSFRTMGPSGLSLTSAPAYISHNVDINGGIVDLGDIISSTLSPGIISSSIYPQLSDVYSSSIQPQSYSTGGYSTTIQPLDYTSGGYSSTPRPQDFVTGEYTSSAQPLDYSSGGYSTTLRPQDFVTGGFSTTLQQDFTSGGYSTTVGPQFGDYSTQGRGSNNYYSVADQKQSYRFERESKKKA